MHGTIPAPSSQTMKARAWRWPLAGLALLALVGCGGGNASASSSSSDSGLVTLPTPTPSPSPAAPTPTPTPTPASWAAAAAALYDVQPNPAACRAGRLKAEVRTRMLALVNAARALHALPPVAYSAIEDQDVAESSLMMAANRTLDHQPASSWTCYTALGASAASTGNLIGGWGHGLPWSSEDDLLAGWLNERNSASIGHRRWILDPFLGQISYGRVAYQSASGERADAATLKVFGFAQATPAPAPTGLPAFVAYPQGDYPARYFGTGDILSFSVVADAANRYGNGTVHFDRATVTVTGGGRTLAVTDVAADNVGFGLPNNLQWRVTGLQSGVTYTVRIDGVTGAPEPRYEYSFRIVE